MRMRLKGNISLEVLKENGLEPRYEVNEKTGEVEINRFITKYAESSFTGLIFRHKERKFLNGLTFYARENYISKSQYVDLEDLDKVNKLLNNGIIEIVK